MATTRILTIHVNKGKSIAKTLSERTNYPQNPEKTISKVIGVKTDKPVEKIIKDSAGYVQNSAKTYGGELVKTYACTQQAIDVEFLLSKKEYDYITGRDQGKRNILAYHIRQSFKPGEIEPQKALEIGYELAMRFTRGKHAFIVATHTDKAHIHNHIVFNSTALSCDKKFKEPHQSGMIIQRISDLLCLENGLSIIENPHPSKGKNYRKWLGNKEPSWQDKLRQKIDKVLPYCKTFDDFISSMKSYGYKVNTDCKHITFLADGQKKATRLNTIKGNYTEEVIRDRITRQLAEDIALNSSTEATPIIYALPTNNSSIKVSLLIDIQEKIKEGKGAGYENRAHIFNIKEAAKTLLYLKEQGIDSYDELIEKTEKISIDFNAVTSQIKDIEARLKDISELQRQIGSYGKTRNVYQAYKKSGFREDFYESNRYAIALHEAAKNHFNSLGIKKLPKIYELKQEYAQLNGMKKKLYVDYHAIKKQHHDILIAKCNTEKILGITPFAKNNMYLQVTDTKKTVRETDEFKRDK